MISLARCIIISSLFLSCGLANAACAGRDLWPELKSKNPQAYAEIEREAAAMPYASGKLFKVTKPGLPPSYLFGTTHTADPRATAFSPALLGALQGAKVAAFELKEVGGLNDPEVMQKMGASLLQYVMPKEGERAAELFNPDQLRDIEGAMSAYGLPKEAINVFKPGFLGLIMSLPACIAGEKASETVDGALALKAKAQGTPIVGLETIEEQLAAITNLPPDQQKELLLETVKLRALSDDIFATMIGFYVRGDIGRFLLWSQHPGALAGLSNPNRGLMEALLDKRNVRMRDRALPLLQNGGAFIAVGAGHLPGEAGLANLFKAAGYGIEKVE